MVGGGWFVVMVGCGYSSGGGGLLWVVPWVLCLFVFSFNCRSFSKFILTYCIYYLKCCMEK